MNLLNKFIQRICSISRYGRSSAAGTNEEEKVKKRFTEMAVLSFSVAAMSFLIGYALKTVTRIEA